MAQVKNHMVGQLVETDADVWAEAEVVRYWQEVGVPALPEHVERLSADMLLLAPPRLA